MIDILALEAIAVFLLLLFAARKRELAHYVWGAAVLAAVFHAISLLVFFSAPVPGFTFTIRGTPAFQAGVRGEGTISAVGGQPPASFGRLAARFLYGGDLDVETNRGSFHKPAYSSSWRPWAPLDSYALEEASGGLSLFERQPVVLSKGGDALLFQLVALDTVGGLRIERAAGARVSTVGDLLTAIGSMPEGGVTPLRVMRPSPDDNVSTILFSPSMMPPLPGGERESPAEKVVRSLGFNGLFAVMRTSKNAELAGFPEKLNGRYVSGIRDLLDGYRRELATRGEATFRFRSGDGVLWRPADQGEVWVRPRAALLPWIGPDAFSSWIVGVVFSPVRQLIGLAQFPLLRRYWLFVPRQLYNLDDAVFRVPGFLAYRLSSLFVSIFLALFAWSFVRRRFQTRPPVWARGIFLLAVIVVLQAGDVMVLYSAVGQ